MNRLIDWLYSVLIANKSETEVSATRKLIIVSIFLAFSIAIIIITIDFISSNIAL